MTGRWWTAVTGTALVIATASPVAAPAQAASRYMCDGRKATIVGHDGEVVRGTPHSDVIVSNGSSGVDAGSGDDFICITGTTQSARVAVRAGSGDDYVSTLASHQSTIAYLGQGSDTYLGGPGEDDVVTFNQDPQGAQPLHHGTDTVSTGAGDDTIAVGEGVPGQYDGGAGTDNIEFAGDFAKAPFKHVTVNLQRGTTHTSSGVAAHLRSVEDVTLIHVLRSTVTGTNTANLISLVGCQATVHAGGGNDRVFQSWLDRNECRGIRSGIDVWGGPGDDLIYGYLGNDRLIGGPGNDHVVGGGGTDICHAELAAQCNERI